MKGAVLPDLVVRSVCVFLPEQECQNEPMFNAAVARAASHASQIRAALEAADVSVQTTRLAVPSPAVFGTTEAALVAAHILDAAPVDSASLGTVHPHQTSFLNLDFILNVLKSTASVFISATIATASALHPAAARVAADVITQAAPHQSGMLNFRFAALANVAPFSPFFPAGYAGPSPTFLTTIGLQAAPLARTTLTARNNAASHRLTNIAEVASHQIVSICAPICEVNVDFSLAPYPTEAASTGRSIAHAGGVRSFGMPGCVAGASLAATAIARAKFSRVGLCGVMLPVSEDVDLAANTTSISELLLCSAVCGTGLDAIPLAGDVTPATIMGILLDVGALSCRLGNKQLTARLIPIPGLKAGDQTQFESEYMCNGPVLRVRAVEEVSDGEIIDDVIPLESLLSLPHYV